MFCVDRANGVVLADRAVVKFKLKLNTMANLLEQEWHSYFEQLNEQERKSVLLMLKTFLLGRHKNEGRISLEQYNVEVDEALAEAVAGNYITQEEMEKRATKW